MVHTLTGVSGRLTTEPSAPTTAQAQVRLLNVVAEQHHPISDGVHLRMGTYAGDGAAEVVTKKASAQASAEQPLDNHRVSFALG